MAGFFKAVAVGDDLLTPAGVVWQRRLEVPVLVSGVLVVPVMVTESLAQSDGWLLAAHAMNWLIWAVFAVELFVLTKLALPGRRRQWLKASWLDVVIVIVAHVSEASLQLPAVLWSTDLPASSPNGVCAVCPYPCDHSPRPKPE